MDICNAQSSGLAARATRARPWVRGGSRRAGQRHRVTAFNRALNVERISIPRPVVDFVPAPAAPVRPVSVIPSSADLVLRRSRRSTRPPKLSHVIYVPEESDDIVVSLALLRVGEDFVGAVGILELFRCLLSALGILLLIGMEFGGQLSIRLA